MSLCSEEQGTFLIYLYPNGPCIPEHGGRHVLSLVCTRKYPECTLLLIGPFYAPMRMHLARGLWQQEHTML